MPMNPQGYQLHIDVLATNHSIMYRNKSYVADQLAPILPVTFQSGIIPKYIQSDFFRDDAKLRAPGTKSQGGGFRVDTTAKYFADRYSFRFEIPDEFRDMTDAPFNLDRDGAFFVADKMQLRRERNMSSTFFTTGVWNGGTDYVGGTNFGQWNNYAGSAPLVDLANYMDVIEGNIAVEGNTLLIGKQVWLQLRWHPDLVDVVKYTQIGKITTDILLTLTDLTKVLVGRGIYVTSAEGLAETSQTYSRIWGKNALIAYVPPSPGLMTPAALYTYVWNRVPNAVQYIKRIRDEERETDILEGNSYFTQVQPSPLAGVFLSAAVA
jgi:hypothetical protein